MVILWSTYYLENLSECGVVHRIRDDLGVLNTVGTFLEQVNGSIYLFQICSFQVEKPLKTLPAISSITTRQGGKTGSADCGPSVTDGS